MQNAEIEALQAQSVNKKGPLRLLAMALFEIARRMPEPKREQQVAEVWDADRLRADLKHRADIDPEETFWLYREEIAVILDQYYDAVQRDKKLGDNDNQLLFDEYLTDLMDRRKMSD